MKTYLSACRKFAGAILAAGLWTVGMGSANAMVINLGDGPSNFAFSTTGGPYELFVSGSLDLIALSDTSATLNITLNNSSTMSGGGAIVSPNNVRLTAFGFGINPNASSVMFSDANDGGMVGASLSQIPSLAQIEVCTFGGNNCAGGSNGGIYTGSSDVFSLVLNGNFGGLNALTFDPLGVKFQTDAGSFEFKCFDTNCSGGTIPEPGALALLGIGLLGFAATRRKQTKS
jgi:hypothetical protein